MGAIEKKENTALEIKHLSPCSWWNRNKTLYLRHETNDYHRLQDIC